MDHLKPFAELGTRLLRPPEVLRERLGRTRALLLDWDGVFNEGWKDAEGGSPFSEVGSMGLNLLRFALWQREQRLIPCAIITGQHNPHAERFARREHLDGVYMGFTNKQEAFTTFLAKHHVEALATAFFFDDVLDLPVARRCGLRVLLPREVSPLFTQHVLAKGDADILTSATGGSHGLREACELLIALTGRTEDTFEHRVRHSAVYQAYLKDRAAIATEVVGNAR